MPLRNHKIIICSVPFLAAMVFGLTSLAQACPRCVEATPFRLGLQWAIVVLLPLPFTLGFFLYRFLRRAFPTETK